MTSSVLRSQTAMPIIFSFRSSTVCCPFFPLRVSYTKDLSHFIPLAGPPPLPFSFSMKIVILFSFCIYLFLPAISWTRIYSVVYKRADLRAAKHLQPTSAIEEFHIVTLYLQISPQRVSRLFVSCLYFSPHVSATYLKCLPCLCTWAAASCGLRGNLYWDSLCLFVFPPPIRLRADCSCYGKSMCYIEKHCPSATHEDKSSGV